MAAGPALAAGPKDLKIIAVDAEGGAATLFITPQGHSLLIDTGFPAGRGGGGAPGAPAPASPPPTTAQKIAAAVKAAGLTKVDYVVSSHYHVDHIGGLEEFSKLVPVGTFIDHGVIREVPPPGVTPTPPQVAMAELYPHYLATIAGHKHMVVKPGQVLRIDGLKITVTNADAEVSKRALGPVNAPAYCGGPTKLDDDGGDENRRSVGMLMEYGKSRILILSDTTWDVEYRMVCPKNTIPPVDLLFATHHASGYSSNPNFLAAAAPRVVVVGNGSRKGADPKVMERLNALPSLEGLWQVHFSTNAGVPNAPEDQIANPAGDDKFLPLEVSVDKARGITMINPRNGFTKVYAPKN
jgi:beta-lactamase superfamily II metal-dependent hydrolase